MKTMYDLGERIESDACGACTITDIYKSVKGKIAYEVTLDEDGTTFVYKEEDL